MDWFSEPGVASIEAGFLSVPPGTDVATWEAVEASSVNMFACHEAPKPEAAVIAGTAGLLLPETCPVDLVGSFPGDQFFINSFLVHGTTGVVIQWESRQGQGAADRASFLRILASLRFGTVG